MKNLINRISFAIVSFLLVARLVIWTLLPMDQAPRHIEGSLIMSLGFLGCSFFFLLKKIIFKEEMFVARPQLLLFSFVLVSVLSIFYSYDPTVTFQSAMNLVAIVAFVWIAADLLRDKKLFIAACYVLVFLAVASSIYALIQYRAFVFDRFEETAERSAQYILMTKRPPSFFGWPNVLAGYLIMVLPLNLALAAYFRRKAHKALALIVALLNVTALFLTLTTASWWSLLAGVGLTVFLLRKEDVVMKNKKFVLIAAAVCLVVIGAVLVKRFVVMKVNSASVRQAYVHNAFELIGRHPFVGNGWNTYSTVTLPMVKNVQERSAYVHNTYLQVWVETGLVGLGLFVGFVFFVLYGAWQRFQGFQSREKWIYWGLWAGAVAFVIDNFFSFTMLKLDTAMFWWFLTGMLLVVEGPKAAIGFRWKRPALIVACILIAVFGYLTLRLYVGEHQYFKAMRTLNQGDAAQAERLFKSAYQWNAWDRKAFYGEALAYCALYNQTREARYILLARDAVLEAAKQPTLKRETDGLLGEIEPAIQGLGL